MYYVQTCLSLLSAMRTLSEPIHCQLEPSIRHNNAEPVDTKEKSNNIWPQRQENEQVIEQQNSKPSLQPNNKSKELFLSPQEFTIPQIIQTHASTAQVLVQHQEDNSRPVSGLKKIYILRIHTAPALVLKRLWSSQPVVEPARNLTKAQNVVKCVVNTTTALPL